ASRHLRHLAGLALYTVVLTGPAPQAGQGAACASAPNRVFQRLGWRPWRSYPCGHEHTRLGPARRVTLAH
ncbi:hypothetical protein, partial [Pseudomonas viridiflava]|uniref:hypothetical protein n=1 Tax=Pseudomonas viridiflava TaxID=33069 RepID=UPI001980B54D